MAVRRTAFSVVPSFAQARAIGSVRRLASRVLAVAVITACGGSGDGPAAPRIVVTTVEVRPSNSSVTVGTSVTLAATARDQNGVAVAAAPIAWASAAPGVATVSANGVVTGIATGVATITATSSGVSGTIQLTVTPDETPTSIVLTPPGPLALVSGASSTVAATVRASDGHVVTTAPVSYRSSDASIAAVTAGVVTAVHVGTAIMTATSGSVSASLSVTVSAGAALQLGIRTAPVGSAVGSPLATQPVIDIRDAAGNAVTTATNAVTAAIATGGGSLGGTTTVAAASGVAAFTNLVVNGTAGTRTLVFTAPGLASITSGDVVLTAPVTPLLVVDSTTLRFTVAAGRTLPAVTLIVRNGGTTALSDVTVSQPAYDAGQPTGWLAVASTGGSPPFSITFQADAITLSPGTYHATVQVTAAAASNSPLALGVTVVVTQGGGITFGSATEKLRVLDAGAAFTPSLTARDATGQPMATGPVSFVSRAPSVATVDAQGRITPVGEGAAWVVAIAMNSADSVFVIVPRAAGGPVLRSDLTTYLVTAGDVTTINVVLDARQTSVGAATVAVGFTTATGVFGSGVTYTVPTGPPVPVAASTNRGVIRVSVASATALTGEIALLRLRVPTPTAGLAGVITLTVTEIVAPDGSDLTSVTTSTRIPIIVP
ncbi:MAG: Ig-like domain-containing protein [bacterium]